MVNLDIHESGFRHTRSSVQIPPPCLLCRSVPPPQSRIRISAVTTCLVCGCVHFCVRAGVCVHNIHIHIYIYNRACVCVCIYVCIIYTQHVSYIHNMYTYTHLHICIRSFLRYAIIAICNQTSVSSDSSTQISSTYKSNKPRPQTKTPCPLCVTHQNTRYVYIHVYIHVYIYTYICLRSNSKKPLSQPTHPAFYTLPIEIRVFCKVTSAARL